jgi:hypothetical protein
MQASSLSVDGLAEAKATLRAADPRMAELVDADPTLDPDAVLDGWPTDLWSALVFQVVGQQLSAGRPGQSWNGSSRYTTGACRRRRSCLR